MANGLFRKIFRKAGSRSPEPGTPAENIHTAEKQGRLFDQPSHAAPPSPEAEPAAERTLPDYIGSALALRDAGRFDEAEKVLVEAVERFPTEPRPQIELALVSHARRDWPEAVQRWELVRGEFPNEPLSYTLAAAALREAGRVDEAEALAATARERFAGDFLAAIEYARAAESRDAPEALKRWQEVRDGFPDRIEGYAGIAGILRRLGRFDDADAVLKAAVEKFPDSRQLLIEFARIAEQRRDWLQALKRWDSFRSAFPDEVWGHVGSALALRELRRFEEADAILSGAIERLPTERRLHVDWALLAQHRADWQEAASRWAKVRALFPQEPAAACFGAAALNRLQKYEEAEAVLSDAREQFPDDLGVAIESAWVATHRRAWAEAVGRWQFVRDRFPDNPRGYTGLAMVQRELGWVAEAEATLAAAAERFPRDPAAHIDRARLAETRRDQPEALRRWQAVRDAFPDHPAGYTGAAALLREARRIEEAEALLAEAAERFPDEARLDIDRAMLAHHRRDWGEAARRWQRVRARLPEERSGYMRGAAVLRELRRLDEAGAVLSAALERFPAEPGLDVEFALLAEARGEWEQAAESWAAFRIAFPEDVRGFTLGARALRQLGRTDEAEAVLADAMSRLPKEAGVAIDYARIAEQRRDWAAAEERWAAVRTRFADRIEGYLGGAEALTAAGRDDEAERLLEAGIAQIAQSARLAAEYGWLALRRQRLDEAEARFATVRERFSDEPAGYRGGAEALLQRSRLAEAETLLEAGMARLPADPHLALTHALIPSSPRQRKRDWDATIARLDALCARFPEFDHGYIAAVRALRECRRIEEAEAVASRGLRQLQAGSAELGIEYARTAQDRADWDAALQRYRDVMQRFPDRAAGFVGLADALARLGRFDAAGPVLAQAMASFPNDPEPFAAFAELAMRENRPAAALRRWDEAVRRFPENARLSQRLFEARLRAAETAPDAVATETAASGSTDISGSGGSEATELPPMAELLGAFESLGGTLLGCEFGLLQRAFGAEPLGLLRWTDMEPDALIAALEAEFDGVGLPENTELLHSGSEASAEYGTRDRRFGMRMHTFVPIREVGEEEMFGRMCRRLQFLKDKLVQDLKSGAKIFVYKITGGNLAPEQLARLRRAMRRYGDNTLLYVRYADETHPNGTVEWAGPGLLIGYIDRFAMSAAGEQLGEATPSWAEICKTAYRLWRARARGEKTPAVISVDLDSLRTELIERKAGHTLQAPLRHKLTQTFGGQLGLFAGAPGVDAPTTYLTIVPLEADCVAVRVAYGNGYATDVAIQSVSVYPSDTYNLAIQTIHNGGLSVPVIPTADGSLNTAGCKLYFDGDGLDAPGRRSGGSNRTKTLVGNPENTANRFLPHAYEWSDWAPCRSLPRADGGIQPLLFIYTTVSSEAGTFAMSNLQALNRGAAVSGRYHFGLKATTRRADFADNPAGTEFHATDGGRVSWNPVVAVQYLTEEAGIQVISVGDSLAVGPTDDPFSNPIWCACVGLSSPALPITYATMACAGAGPPVYNALTLLNGEAIQPSIAALQVITRNGYAGHAHMQLLLAEMLDLAGQLEAQYGTRFLFNIPGGEPTWEENAAWADAFVEMRDALLGASDATGVVVIDAPAVTAPASAPWRYVDGVSNDGVHLNTVGAERVVPMALRAVHHSLRADRPKFDHVLRHFEPMIRRVAQHDGPEQFGLMESEAKRCMDEQNWSAALGKYDELRHRFPDRPAGYVGGVLALRQLGETEAADTLVLEAIERFPEDRWLMIQRAQLAMRQQDWAPAEGWWRDLLSGKNEHWWVHLHLSRALREQGRLAEAEAALVEGQTRFPAELGLFAEHAQQATQRRDWAEALVRWQLVRDKFPASSRGYTGMATAQREVGRIDEAEATLKEAIERFPEDSRLAIEFAMMAHHLRQWDDAVTRWERVRARFPDSAEGYFLASIALNHVRRQEEAEQVIAEGARRLPDSVDLAGQFAWAAAHQHRWPEAEARFAEVRERFPDAPVGYIGGAAAHRAQGRLADAEAVLDAGMTRLPRQPEIAQEYARLPLIPEHHFQKDWDRALSRFEALRTSFPSYEPGWLDSIRYARQAERLDLAGELAAAAMQKFPNSAEVALQWATAALDRGKHDEAVTRFQTVVQRFENREAGYTGMANALARAGRHDEANEILRTAQDRFPHNAEVACAFAHAATLRLDWKGAFERLIQAQRQFPHDREVSRQLFAARLRLAETEDTADAHAADAELGAITSAGSASLPPQQLVAQFESLGGTAKGCEFGLFQREFGVEPLGLLRWTDVDPENLIAALEARFDGVGLPENTEIYPVSAGGPPEWQSSDSRFGMLMHTFAPADSVPRERMFAQVCRRLQFLREKLIADLEAGGKIFVYKITARDLTGEELSTLHKAMRRYGDNTLLYVRYADADHPAETVDMVEPGLMIGCIDRFWVARDGDSIGPVTQSWLTICRNAYALWQPRHVAGTAATQFPSGDGGEPEDRLDLPPRDLVMHFESLGGSGHGCEFGIFQREFDAEPLGLLRWADLGHEALAEALETEFDGVGLPEHTLLFVPPTDGRREYWTRDKRYWMAMRTFVPADEIAEDKMFERVCRRLQFLRRKLIEDLAAGNKIFVYKVLARNLTEAEIGRLRRAARRYGENTLLYVGYAEAEHPRGTVELAEPGLMLGYVERFAFSADDENLGPATEGWLAVCRAAYRLWKSGTAVSATVSAEQLEPATI